MEPGSERSLRPSLRKGLERLDLRAVGANTTKEPCTAGCVVYRERAPADVMQRESWQSLRGRLGSAPPGAWVFKLRSA